MAAPIEQQMTGVDKMLYMYSTSASTGGQMNLRVDFDIVTNPSTDQVLAQMRYSQAASQLPAQVTDVGVTIRKSASSPLALFSLYSPKGTYDQLFISNYAYININDPMTRVPGIGQVQIFGAGPYAMRLWLSPDLLAKLEITVNEVVDAIQAQSTVNAAGQIGGNPVPPGQQFTYTVRAPGRLVSAADFGEIVVRARPDGSVVRVKDVARVELGAQNYTIDGRLNGRPATVIAVYQLPGSNALATVARARALMEEMKSRFPEDLDYVVSLDTTLSVTAGIARDRRHPVRGPRPRDPRGLPLPPGLPGHPDPAARRARVAGRHVRRLPAARLLDQHAVAVRPRAGHRPRRRRRHRGRGGRRAPHRARACPRATPP